MNALARLRRFLNACRKPEPGPIVAVQPRVTPDPQHAAELERRFSELAYEPESGFAKDTRVERSNVIPMRRRSRS